MANGKGGRPKNKIRSIKVDLSGFISPVFDSDVLEWIGSLPKGKRFSIVVNILKIVIDLVIIDSGNDAADIRHFIENNKRTLTVPNMQKRVQSLKLRWEIFERDKFRCVVCGRSAEDGVKLHVDHIYPQSKGGSNAKSNLATLCDECNLGKSDGISDENYMKVIKG